MIHIKSTWQRMIVTSDGNDLVGEPVRIEMVAASVSEYYKRVQEILDVGVWAEISGL